MTTAMTPEQEFEAAFNENADAKSALPGEQPMVKGAPAAQAAAEDPAQDQNKPKQEPAGNAPAPQADVQGEQKPAESEVDKLRRELAEAQHRERSASQRVSAFHRQYNQAAAELAELKKLQSAPRADQPTQSAAEDDPDLQSLLNEMPELGKVVDRLVAKRVAESVGTVQKEIQPLRERAAQDDLRQQLSAVEKEFPAWREIVYGEDFSKWIEAKPASIRRAYDSAATAEDAIEFLRMYHRESGVQQTPAEPNQGTPAGTTKPAESATQQRLRQAVGVPSRSTAAPLTGMPPANDFDASFAYFAARQQA